MTREEKWHYIVDTLTHSWTDLGIIRWLDRHRDETLDQLVARCTAEREGQIAT